jgi:hypothetical protein
LDKNIKIIIDDMICKKKKENYMLDEPHDDTIYEGWVHDLFCVEEETEETAGDDENQIELTKEQSEAKKAKEAEDEEDKHDHQHENETD